MIRLERSESLGRLARMDDIPDLAMSDWEITAAAIKTGETGRALEFLDYTRDRNKANSDSLVSFTEMVLTYLAGLGEEHVPAILRQRYYHRMRESLASRPSVEELVQRTTEVQRSHHAAFSVTEEPDRYVVRYDPCGSGGRLRRTRKVGVTSKAYPWSFGKAGVPYYCCHCCVCWEHIATELVGYPMRINILGEKPEDPCLHIFYKKADLVPEEYFTRVGKVKP